MTTRLDQILAQARAAVLGRGVLDPFSGSGIIPIDRSDCRRSTLSNLDELLVVTTRNTHETAPAVPVVGIKSTLPVLEVGPWPSCAAVAGASTLSRGAGRVFTVLHRLAFDISKLRGYAAVPNQVVFHCPAVMVAALVGYTDRHLRTLVGELEAAGLLDAGGHAQTGPAGRWMYSGTVWAVKVKPGDFTAHVHPDEWKQTWRPNFKTDVEGKRGAARLTSELVHQQADAEVIYRAVLRAAAGDLDYSVPLMSSSEVTRDEALKTVQDVVYLLGSGDLLALHPTKRGQLVGVMANVLARRLDGELRWRRWYAGTILDALEVEGQGRQGLQTLAAALSRIDADVREGAPWERPGAVLASRLRSAS